MSGNKGYFTAPPGLAAEPAGFEVQTEREPLDRRDFLKMAGFSLAAGALWTGCGRAPVHKAIPYLIPPEQIVPGEAAHVGTVCGACTAGCGLLVKTRDGRPIKLEGNPAHPLSRGGLCPVGQASLLGLYDERRLKAPLVKGAETDWASLDATLVAQLTVIRRNGGALRFLTGTITSPTTRGALGRFLAGFPGAGYVTYDPLSHSAILDAHLKTHGLRALPRYRFDRAEAVVGFEADFLGTWISPVEFTAGYAPGRDPDRRDPPDMSYHAQFESHLTVTGAKADDRYPQTPGESVAAMAHLASLLSRRAGIPVASDSSLTPPKLPAAIIEDLAERLWQHRKESLVVCGLQDIAAQSLCNLINEALGNYGATLDIASPSYQQQGDDRALSELLAELEAGKIAALFIHGVNPVVDLPDGNRLTDAIRRVPLVVAIAERADETTELAHYICAESHYLESWSDSEPVGGVVAVAQPSLNPFGETRTLAEMLDAWIGAPAAASDKQNTPPSSPPQAGGWGGQELVRRHWERKVLPRSRAGLSFQAFWDKALRHGFVEVDSIETSPKPFDPSAVAMPPAAPSFSGEGFTLALHPTVAMMDGRHAHNPFLYELPDPITKVTWDNVATLSPRAAKKLDLRPGDIVRIEAPDRASGHSLELPVFVQPGQADGVVAVALGYGRRESCRFKEIGPQWLFGKGSVGDDGLVGKNAAPLVGWSDGIRSYTLGRVTVTPTGARRSLACTQEHGDLHERDHILPAGSHSPAIVREGTLADYRDDPTLVVPLVEHEGYDLWPEDHPLPVHRWGMVVDMNRCTGCSACLISCSIENNVPVVGRDEVQRNRELHWLRIDRYYAEEDGRLSVTFLPMMCQQCGHAPCETVCPVLATIHSEEGLNQQVYNRCVGTRYCANNCPYKVRRFNWFSYTFAHNGRERLMLNPDVTVRSRGVMEKCSFCVQRIQAAKAQAKVEGRLVRDGEIRPACQQSCPAGAIVFGDLNDPHSRVSKLMSSPRRYKVLEELNVRPAVGYLAAVRNPAHSEETTPPTPPSIEAGGRSGGRHAAGERDG